MSAAELEGGGDRTVLDFAHSSALANPRALPLVVYGTAGVETGRVLPSRGGVLGERAARLRHPSHAPRAELRRLRAEIALRVTTPSDFMEEPCASNRSQACCELCTG